MTTTFASSAQVDVSQETGTLILRICGELDRATRELVEPAILGAIPTANTVALDLGDLASCDSNSVAMFIAAHEKAAAEGTTLVLAGPQPSVRRVFEITGVDQVLNITEVEDSR